MWIPVHVFVWLHLSGFTLVIAPLVSLMEDQLMYLKSVNVPAVTLNASSTKVQYGGCTGQIWVTYNADVHVHLQEDSKRVLAGMIDKNSPFKLLYVTPEKIAKSKLLMSKLEKAYNMGLLARIAVDEVHCCSQWGHDFRPGEILFHPNGVKIVSHDWICNLFLFLDYKLLGILKRQFSKVPLVGLTATATRNVLKDCQKILCVQEPITLTAPFNRPNLYYEVCLSII